MGVQDKPWPREGGGRNELCKGQRPCCKTSAPLNYRQVLQQEGALGPEQGPQEEEEEVPLPWAELGLKDITAESTKGHLLQGLSALETGTFLLPAQARAAPSCIPAGRAPTFSRAQLGPGGSTRDG